MRSGSGRSRTGRAENPEPAPDRSGSVTLVDLFEGSGYRPLSDVTEAGDAVRIRLELPGVPAASVQVWVRGNRLDVSGEKAPDFPPGEAGYLCLERIFGKFRRVFEVVGSVNLAQVTARLRGGILEIVIPKVRERRGRDRRVAVTED